jgi:hypothetical protein
MNQVEYQPVDCAYLAGLVDADGHIGLRWDRSFSTGKWLIVAGFGVGSIDLPTLQWCYQTFPFGSLKPKAQISPISKKPQYEWRVYKRRQILFLLRLIEPYMHTKRATAQRMIEEIESYSGARLAPGWTTVVH